ncbi:MAG TPA: hypothetical protein VIJ68_04765 [Candidatus Saccharimonadales bacterium]
MDDAEQQLIERLKSANNVLVTVSRNPSVDQLASCIGLTLFLNKQGKHAAAVFSGQVPSTLEFLQPDETIEKNTDSLRDFIIALDKSKADKLRYKVEDNVVRIFITPYKTSISQDDLEFSEGDFNVDVVVALGVRQQEDLDEAIVAHGRILHDATVASLNTAPDGGLGSINWYDPQSSSLSELVTYLVEALDPEQLDNQIATALLTGIVSETERFSNDKTSSQTMSASAALMSAGANQQLVASKLEEGAKLPPAAPEAGDYKGPADDTPDDGTLQIDHTSEPPSEQPGPGNTSADTPEPEPEAEPADKSKNSEPPEPPTPEPTEQPSNLSHGAKLLTSPPSLGGTLTANTQEEALDPTSDPFSLPSAEPPQMLDRKPAMATTASTPSPAPLPEPVAAPAPASVPTPTPVPEPPLPSPLSSAPTPDPLSASLTPAADDPLNPSPDPLKLDDKDDQTLTQLEQSVDSPHVQEESVDTARDEVSKALMDGSTEEDDPIEGLNAQPLGGNLHDDSSAPSSTPQVTDPTAPPPVPPPIPFQFGNSAPHE